MKLLHTKTYVNLINIFRKLYLAFGIFILNNFAFALTTGAMPSEITSNTNIYESVIAWAFKIGGMGAVAWAGIAFARNKLQGQAADQMLLLIIGLGGAAFGMGWWLGQSATSSAGFVFG